MKDIPKDGLCLLSVGTALGVVPATGCLWRVNKAQRGSPGKTRREVCPEDTQGGQAAGPGPWQRQARGLREGRENFVICTQPRGEVSRGHPTPVCNASSSPEVTEYWRILKACCGGRAHGGDRACGGAIPQNLAGQPGRKENM